jgi:hypothetical protein
VGRPKTLGFQADMAHTLLYTLGYNAPQDRILPEDFTWDQASRFQEALKTLTAALRPWTFDFHVAQNDATVKGSGTHSVTGHHCLATDPNGKLDITRDAGFWLRDEQGNLTKAFRHVCWDGCMFPNEVMLKPQTWNDILAAMIAVRDAHGWSEAPAAPATPAPAVEVRAAKPAPRAKAHAAPKAKAKAKPARPATARKAKPAKKAKKPAARKAKKPAPKVKSRPARKVTPKRGKAAAKKSVKRTSKPKARRGARKGKRK